MFSPVGNVDSPFVCMAHRLVYCMNGLPVTVLYGIYIRMWKSASSYFNPGGDDRPSAPFKRKNDC